MKKTKTKISKKPQSGNLGPFQVGDVVVIRAIPFHYIGKIESMDERTVTLAAGAVWLADSTRWFNFLQDGEVNEAEPYPDSVTIGHGVIADVTKWRHAIPGQK